MNHDGWLLAGAVVQRVDAGPGLMVLRLRAPGETSFVIAAAGLVARVGLAAKKPFQGHGLPGGSLPTGETMRLRTKLEGARVRWISARCLALDKEETRVLIEVSGVGVTLRTLPNGEEVGEEMARIEQRDTLLDEGARIEQTLRCDALETRRHALERALAKALARVERRVAAVRGDLARIGEADALAARAALFVPEASRAPRGASRLVVIDWSTGEATLVELTLDPARSAREQIEGMFKRARRWKLGAAIAQRRLEEATVMAARLAAVASRMNEACSWAELEALAAEAKAAAPKDLVWTTGPAEATGTGSAKETPSRPYRVFRGSLHARILVGRGAAHNDALTFHVARPHELWLHAKGRAGAHVIVPLDKGHTCPSELLVDAAHLAAHFSEARDEGVVEVQYTARRYLQKPKGAAPGFVRVQREKVLVLRVEPERSARLLGTEESV